MTTPDHASSILMLFILTGAPRPLYAISLGNLAVFLICLSFLHAFAFSSIKPVTATIASQRSSIKNSFSGEKGPQKSRPFIIVFQCLSSAMTLPQITAPAFSVPHSPTPTTTLENFQQLQRVETLHQQVKEQAQRAQEFLMKLRRGELEAQTQAQLQLEQRLKDREGSDRRRHSEGKHSLCTCSCPHHASPPPPPPTGSTTQTAAQNRNSFSAINPVPMGPLPLPTRVDEKEVRDLEKRVRGLEGRVRGFEGLPPDREMALLEVERLRRELEGLARRREGLFEGLSCEDALSFGGASAEGLRGKDGLPPGGQNVGGKVVVKGLKGSGRGAKKEQ